MGHPDNPNRLQPSQEEPPDPGAPSVPGLIERMIRGYDTESALLLGFPLELAYRECKILTCDSWKIQVGGIPQGKFFLLKLAPRVVTADPRLGRHLILCRVLDTTPLPVEEEILLTLLQIHKMQVAPDPVTNSELQWCALKTRVVGMFYDAADGQEPRVEFGSDMDLCLSPHLYEAYVPEAKDLDFLLNLFVSGKNPFPIGQVRYSESLAFMGMSGVPILVSPEDFIGYRAGIFGRTRLGKSNLIKIIAEMILCSGRKVGQLIFDASGEYTYLNNQDQTSLYLLHKNRCIRFSLKPFLSEDEQALGLKAPLLLQVNFFKQIALGHAILVGLYDTVNEKRPDYVNPLLSWEVVDEEQVAEQFPERGDQVRYLRALSMYLVLLSLAGFKPPNQMRIDLHIHQELRRELAKQERLKIGVTKKEVNGEVEIADEQPIESAGIVYAELYRLYTSQKNQKALFPTSSRSGKPYFESLELSLLRMLGDGRISGPAKFSRLAQFHNPAGSNVIQKIIKLLDANWTVILDLSAANEDLAREYSTLICRAVLQSQMEMFMLNKLGDHFVMFYFEEAHRLFPQDDRNLRNIYNTLAKEGAKFHIGMIYCTQSVTSISPDLLKNTENLFITHLSDDRDLRELSHRSEFEDVIEGIQRNQTRGFVRMITQAHRFALPVQIRKFQGTPPIRQAHPGKGQS